MSLFRYVNQFFRIIRAPFELFRSFLRTNPLTQGYRAIAGVGRQFNQSLSGPSRALKRIIPKRFRTASPRGEEDEDKDLPPEEAARRGGRRRAQRGRRVRTARKVEFTQVHLINQHGRQRQIVHVGSEVGARASEIILRPGTRRAIRLQFAAVDEAIHGTPLAVTLLSGPRDATLMVDNRDARPTAPIRNGAELNVDGENYTIELYAGGSLPAQTRVDAAWGTNVGPRRDQNQDAVGIYQHPDAYMFTIADGVGGGYAGDEVSEYAVKYLQSVFKKNIEYQNLSWYDIYNTAYSYINQEVRNWVQRTPQPAGTTLTSMFIRNWSAYIAHAGDSRVYLLRYGELQQLTTDHNADVEIETRNRAGYPVTVVKSILQKAIGKTDTIAPDIMTISLQPRDRILMLTDGVSNRVDDQEIETILTNNSIALVPDELIELANSRDNTDNASAIALEVMEEAYERDVWVADPEDRVYVGGPAWYLKLSQPQDMNTVYSFLTGTGCLIIMFAVFLFGTFWAVDTVRGVFVRDRAASVSAPSAEPPSQFTLTPAAEAGESEPDDEVETETGDDSAAGLLGGFFGGLIDETPTASPAPATQVQPTPTPRPSATPLPTLTPLPTFTSTVRVEISPTPIPPTSTVRPGQ